MEWRENNEAFRDYKFVIDVPVVKPRTTSCLSPLPMPKLGDSVPGSTRRLRRFP